MGLLPTDQDVIDELRRKLQETRRLEKLVRCEIKKLQAEVGRLRAENAGLRKELGAEHDTAVRNDELRKMAAEMAADYEMLQSENESMQELSNRLLG